MSKFLEGRVVTLERWTERLHSLQVEAPVEPLLYAPSFSTDAEIQ